MLDDLEQLAWRWRKHNYGKATNVPGWLRDCASGDAERAEAALDEFDVAVFHQGGWICSAAPAALPFLVDLRRPETARVAAGCGVGALAGDR